MSEKKTKNLEQFGRVEKLAIAAFILLIAIGVLSASRLSERIVNTFADNPAKQTFQNSSQPLSPVTSNTPQLSKELIYAGSSRLLAVEDANAPALPTSCTPALTITEGDLAPGGIASFVVTSGAESVTVDHVNGGSGLQSFTLVSATNATVNLPTFTPGTYDPTTATFTAPDPSQPVDFRLRAANAFHSIFVRVRCS